MTDDTLMSWPLDDTLLVEASAGTGKTYAITALHARLIVEYGMPVERILAVTYTEAATRELRGRIRRRLVTLREAFENGAGDDPLCRRMLAASADPALAERRLKRAISGFDQAPVYTIHGFCQRVLAESAFESGTLFDAGVLTSEAELRREICDDFWRTVIVHQPRPVVEALVAQNVAADDLVQWIGANTLRDYLTVLPAAPRSSELLATVESQMARDYRRTHGAWRVERERVRAELLDSPALSRTRYAVKSIPAWIESMDAMLLPSEPHTVRFERFDRFTRGVLEAATKKGHETPDNPFFDACTDLDAVDRRLEAVVGDRINELKLALRDYVRDELTARKAARRWLSFDDLLTRVRNALAGQGGERLAALLRRRYPAALIDEFQDTDPVQLGIFDAIYGGQAASRVFVGDPKQAIYSFRGADLFAYLAGRERADTTKTLDTNYRSDPALVSAVNRLFSRHAQPFVFDGLDYPQVRGVEDNRAMLIEDGASGARLRFRYLAREAFATSNKPIAKDRARAAICRDVAAEIVRLLDAASVGRAWLDGRALNGGDIAILVRSHEQARDMQNVLASAGVPSVRQGADNVFHSDEAAALEQVLRAVAEPGRESRLRTALVSSLIGHCGNDLLDLAADDRAWDRVVERFRGYHSTWRARGFMPMFRALLVDHDAYAAILGREGGERRLTNFLHLAELMHNHVHEGDAGMEVAIKWLSAMRSTTATESEAAQLRLESDAERVKIITMHASKGLEYPLVFCPFAWDGRLRCGGDEEILFHDAAAGNRATLDLGSPDAGVHRARALREEFAESVRLLYVALTRAAQRCYVYYGDLRDAGTSPLAWLLHLSVDDAGEPFDPARLAKRFEALGDSRRLADLREMCQADPEGISVDTVDPDARMATLALPEAGPAEPAVKSFDRVLSRPWRIGSFTSLQAGASEEAPDHDAVVHEPIEAATADGVPELSIHRYPRGARTGLCWHSVFEHIDFVGLDDGTLHATVMSELARAGIDAAWAPATMDMVRNALSTDLSPGEGMRLDGVAVDRRINEMGFFFPVHRLRAPALAEVLASHGGRRADDYAASAGRLRFESLHGFLRGFIDLVFEHQGRFYLLDYKSNYLGPSTNHYDAEHLDAAMRREGYHLQYLLYVVALHRYLRTRVAHYDYQRHVGGVRYLFLRGLGAGADRGVYSDRPPATLIDALDRYFDSADTP